MISKIFLSFGLVLLPFATAAVHDIQVGGDAGKLEFIPEAIAAQPGDQVVFHFHPKNHTVTQSSFADPCGLKEGGFDSGFLPVLANVTDNFPTYSITVNDTQPIWVYCRQQAKTPGSHCGQGMVFAVNCGADGAPNSFTNFKKSALAVGASLQAQASSSNSANSGYGGYPDSSGGGASGTWTAAYGKVTIPPPPSAAVVTQTITLESSTWTTTYTSYAGSPDPTPASLTGQVHKVIVGGPGKLVFDPPRVDAKPRDIITFEFHQKNHTVTQSSFADPCRKLSANGVDGWDSGFMSVVDNANTFPTWSITVNDTAPIWAYCRQKTPTSHCGAGMVFAVNSVESSPRSFAAFQSVAEQLNGTAAADTVASSTGSPASSASGNRSNGAMSPRVGFGVLALGFAAVVSLL